jgi:LPXTG-site transpeptidase (sortase) family protein
LLVYLRAADLFMQVRRTSVVPQPRRFRVDRSQFMLKPELWRPFRSCTKSEHRQLWFDSRPEPRQIASYLLILIGTVLCAYVCGTYLWMYAQQKVLLHEWKHAELNPALTKLSIPRIHLQNIVLEGASTHSLLLGPAHLSDTAVPGTLGNAAIAGHRDTFFRHIHSLRYGDDIFILREGRLFHYVVRGRKVVDARDLSVLRPTKDGELTLITCYPTHAIGPAPQRLIVVAKLVSRPEPAGVAEALNGSRSDAVLDAKRDVAARDIFGRVGAELQYLLK